MKDENNTDVLVILTPHYMRSVDRLRVFPTEKDADVLRRCLADVHKRLYSGPDYKEERHRREPTPDERLWGSLRKQYRDRTGHWPEEEGTPR